MMTEAVVGFRAGGTLTEFDGTMETSSGLAKTARLGRLGLGREALLPTRGDSAGSCREQHMADSGGWASWATRLGLEIGLLVGSFLLFKNANFLHFFQQGLLFFSFNFLYKNTQLNSTK